MVWLSQTMDMNCELLYEEWKGKKLPPASGMEADDRDEYDRMLEDKAKYPHGFWEGVGELEYRLRHYILLFLHFLILSIPKIFRDHFMSSVGPHYDPGFGFVQSYVR